MDKEISVQTVTQENKNTQQETYHIWNYMKEHTGLLIATVSAIIAVISFVISLFSFIYQRLVLQTWNVNALVIDLSNDGQIYYFLIIGLVYSVSISLINNILCGIFEKHQKISADYFISCEIYKQLKLKARTAQKGQRYINESDKQVGAEIETSLRRIIGDLAELKKGLKRYRRVLLSNTIWNIIIVALCSFPIAILLTATIGEVSWSIIVFWILSFSFSVLTAKIFVRIPNRNFTRRSIRNMVKSKLQEDGDAVENLLPLTNLGDKIFDEMSPSITKSTILSDRRIKELFQTLIIGLISLLLMVLVCSESGARNQKSFWIYSDTGNEYAVIYQSGNKYVLKKAIIDGDILTIDTSEQRITYCDDIMLEYMQFFEVNRK